MDHVHTGVASSQSISSNWESTTEAASMDMSEMDTMNMMSYYHVGYKEFILFYELRTLSAGAMVGACLIIFGIAVLYEGIKFLRDYLRQRLDPAPNVGAINSSNDNPFVTGGAGSSEKLSKRAAARISPKRAILSSSHFLQTTLHVIQIFISYCLMLIVMTFNVWLIIAVISGSGVGYFLFGWMKRMFSDDSDHDH